MVELKWAQGSHTWQEKANKEFPLNWEMITQ